MKKHKQHKNHVDNYLIPPMVDRVSVKLRIRLKEQIRSYFSLDGLDLKLYVENEIYEKTQTNFI